MLNRLSIVVGIHDRVSEGAHPENGAFFCAIDIAYVMPASLLKMGMLASLLKMLV
jgi:hypothetical protein